MTGSFPVNDIFTSPATFATYLDEGLYDFDGPGVVIRDYNDRPWIVGFDEGGDAFVISYPLGKNENDRPKRKTYHGGLDLPTYPIRVIKES